MFLPGLCSVSFRALSPEQIVTLAARAGLFCIEWGGDVHVPPGDFGNAARVARLTEEFGLRCASYGSYYRIGAGQSAQLPVILDTAEALGVSTVRIWCGTQASASVLPETLEAMRLEAQKAAALAAKRKMTLSLECHPGTLTDDWRAALDFIRAVDQPALLMYWQPNQWRDTAYNLESVRKLSPLITNVHVFHWIQKAKYPLDMGASIWRRYLAALDCTCDHALLLEFMHDGAPESLEKTARALKQILEEPLK